MVIKNKPDTARELLFESYQTYPKRMAPLLTKAHLDQQVGDQQSFDESIELLQKNKLKPYAPRSEIQKLLNDQSKHQHE